MRHPENPFSPDEPAADAPAGWPDDRYDVTPEAAPGHGSGTPPPLPRRTGDSGFRPHEQPGPAEQDFRGALDAQRSWPLAPRPQAQPLNSWADADPQLAWAAPPGEEAQDCWIPVDPPETERARPPGAPALDEQPEPWDYGDPGDSWPPEAVWRESPGEGWEYAAPGESAPAGGPAPGEAQEARDYAGPQGAPPAETPAQGEAREPWVHADPDGPWEPPQPQQGWAAAPPAQAEPREPWTPPERPPVVPDEPWLRERGTPRRRPRGWGGRRAGRDRGGPSQPGPDPAEAPQPDPREAGTAPAGAGHSAEPEAGAIPEPMGFQDLWEPWEPPCAPSGSVSDQAGWPAPPHPEMVRDAEYEDDLWEIPPGPGGPGGGGPRRGAQHTRSLRRPRRGGSAFLAMAAALVIGAGIPIGMLAARTLAHHGGTALRVAPLSASQAARASRASGAAGAAGAARGAATFSALAGPGCPAVTSATVFPYHAPDGDGWHPATASRGGPCGSSFLFSYLAMVPGNPGEWHDHYDWVFHTGMSNPSCTFSLYIPAAPEANSTVYYWFSAGDTNANDRIADFTIDQAADQGQWVTHGPFTFPGGTVLIEATDRGEGLPTGSVEAGPARLSC